jgi:hypothetical protein
LIRVKNPNGSSGVALAKGEIPSTTGGACETAKDLISSELIALKKAAAAASVVSFVPPLGGC